jgi:hypothetical protein
VVVVEVVEAEVLVDELGVGVVMGVFTGVDLVTRVVGVVVGVLTGVLGVVLGVVVGVVVGVVTGVLTGVLGVVVGVLTGVLTGVDEPHVYPFSMNLALSIRSPKGRLELGQIKSKKSVSTEAIATHGAASVLKGIPTPDPVESYVDSTDSETMTVSCPVEP